MEKSLAIAEVLAYVRQNRTPLAELPPEAIPHDEADAYRVQDALHNLLSPHFGTQVGYKIGCTSAVMQQYLGIDHPCAGGLYMGSVHASGASLRYADYVHVGVECEIAVRLAHDLTSSGEPFTAATVAPAIEAYFPAIEIVDDRYADWRGMDPRALIADDFFAAGCVLGKGVAPGNAPDLLSVTGRAVVNGVEIGRGTGADVLGHPHHALAWLANHLAAQGKTLRAGEFVLTGSLVQTAWLNAGDEVWMELSGLGSVAVDFKA
ncbi:hydratase [Tardiphaga alba]|uniref:Hydratase n=1 Tax=Tardiphaga alba TaxID=340268 RepID=A0ABX8AB97_9BRAD|nr:fumarylacetoacetate hydrolase family protein [Tardiphaga alba]QUS40977.1 hydratase [Tardiphaga alba]